MIMNGVYCRNLHCEDWKSQTPRSIPPRRLWETVLKGNGNLNTLPWFPKIKIKIKNKNKKQKIRNKNKKQKQKQKKAKTKKKITKKWTFLQRNGDQGNGDLNVLSGFPKHRVWITVLQKK